jgi:hypothetical protein
MRATERGCFGMVLAALLLSAAVLASTGCSRKKDEPSPPEAPPPSDPQAAAARLEASPAATEAAVEEPLPPLEYESALDDDVRARIDEPFMGDLDAMVERRLVRVGVAYNRTL